MKTKLTFLTTMLATLVAHAGLEISSISLSPSSATAGQSITGTAHLTEGCKYSAGCIVTLKSSNTAVASVPASATVASGATSKTFTFAAGSTSGSASITGTFEGKSASASLIVSGGATAPAPTPICTANSTRSCTISNGSGQQTCNSSGSAWSSCLASSCNSGYTLQNGSCVASQSTSSGTLNVFQLSGDAASGYNSMGVSSGAKVEAYANILSACSNSAGCEVRFTSSNPAVLPMPASMIIPSSLIATTAIATAGVVSDPTTVSVTATAGGISKTLSIVIFPGAVPPRIMHMYIFGDGGYSPVSGQMINMQLNMNGSCPTGGCLVSMSSSNMNAAPVPAQVLVPAGQSFVRFPVRAGTVSAKTTVTITASFYGQSYNTGSQLSVRAPWPRNADGSISMVAVTQNPGSTTVIPNPIQEARAYQNGLDSMMYTDVAINLYNQCQAAFAGNGQLIATSEPTQLPRVSNGYNYYYSYTQNYNCNAGYTGWLYSLTTTAGYVTAPQGFTVTACIEKPAAANVVVNFSSSTTAARVPSSATILAGQLCVTVNVTTASLNDGYAGIDARITAKLNGLWINAIKTVYY